MEEVKNSGLAPATATKETAVQEPYPGKAYFIRHGESTSNEVDPMGWTILRDL